MSREDRYVRIGLRHTAGVAHVFKLCAMVIRGGRILAISPNSDKTDPLFARNPELNRGLKPGKKVDKLHAELACLRLLSPDQLRGSDIVVIRSSKKKGLGNARPCLMCWREMKKAGVRRVYYSLDYGGMQMEKIR